MAPIIRSEFDESNITQQTMEMTTNYHQAHNNNVDIKIANGLSEFRTLVHFRFLVCVSWRAIASARDLPFLECSVYWPPKGKEKLADREEKPLVIEKFEDCCHDEVPLRIRWEYKEEKDISGKIHGKTQFFLRSEVDIDWLAEVVPDLPRDSVDYCTIEIKFDSPSALYAIPPKHLLRDREPYGRSELSLGIHFAEYTVDKTIMHIAYPSKVSYRLRKDNSDYQSQAMNLDAKYH